MNPNDVQQLAQAFVASWETQLARLLREPHTLAAMMAAAQPKASPFAAPNPFTANPSTTNPFTANPFAANPFADFMGGEPHVPNTTAGQQPADHASHAATGDFAVGDGAARFDALERELDALRRRVERLEHERDHAGMDEPAPRPAAKRASSPAGAGSRKAAGAKSKRTG